MDKPHKRAVKYVGPINMAMVYVTFNPWDHQKFAAAPMHSLHTVHTLPIIPG